MFFFAPLDKRESEKVQNRKLNNIYSLVHLHFHRLFLYFYDSIWQFYFKCVLFENMYYFVLFVYISFTYKRIEAQISKKQAKHSQLDCVFFVMLLLFVRNRFSVYDATEYRLPSYADCFQFSSLVYFYGIKRNI